MPRWLSATMRMTIAIAIGLLAYHRAEAQQTELLTVKQAQVVLLSDGQEHAATTVSLPLHWDAMYQRKPGIATITASFDRPSGSKGATEPYMLFMLRIGNAYSIELNGTLIASAGDLDDSGARWSSKRPVGITFPANMLVDRNTLTIRLRGDASRRAGLSPIVLGPAHLVEPLRSDAYALRVVVTMACVMFSLLVSGFCFLLWLQQRDKLYAWACIGEAIWAVVVADVIWESLPMRWPAWIVTLVILRTVWLWALYVVVEQVFGQHPKLERRAMKLAVFSAPIALLFSAATQSSAPFQAWRGILSLLFVAMLVRLLFRLSKPDASERTLLWLAIATLLAAGFHDGLAESLVPTRYGDAEWAKYAGSLLAMTIMWIVSKRFRSARAEANRLQATLEQRIDEKESELRVTFQRLTETERARAVVAERERILRDMHDGVGANLATAMRQLESGTAPPREVAQTLRESLDHLKLSIDAMNLPAGDVNALLASLRYRLQSRIESAGLTFEWQVDLLPHWSRGSDQAMRHLQFLLLEAISNILQHANASILTLSARATDGRIEIDLRDNGRGFDGEPTNKAGRGLQSMRERAALIGAELSIEPTTPGTRVRAVFAA